MRRINEIFSSLQGEGAYAGVPSVFIRFAGCNLKCPFCDTYHEIGRPMTDEEIIEEVKRYPARHIVLTGGEPSLQIDAEFIDILKRSTGKEIAIETNGTHPVPDNIDFVTVSPKTGISTPDLALKVEHADELKVVDVGQPLNQYFELSCVDGRTQMFLQPCHVENPEEFSANLQATIDRTMTDPRWRLSVQLHRFLNIP